MKSGKKRGSRTMGEKMSRKECRSRFISLYARWERTHNLELIPLLCHHLDRLIRLEPQFDLRREFEMAF